MEHNDSKQSISWQDMTDAQKARFFLHSSRLSDTRQFTSEFISWEEPSVESVEVKSNDIEDSQPPHHYEAFDLATNRHQPPILLRLKTPRS